MTKLPLSVEIERDRGERNITKIREKGKERVKKREREKRGERRGRGRKGISTTAITTVDGSPTKRRNADPLPD